MKKQENCSVILNCERKNLTQIPRITWHGLVCATHKIFAKCPEVKKKLWGGNFWSSGYYVATVSEHGNEDVIENYVKNQGNEYKKLFRNTGLDGQMSLFDYM